MRHVKTYNFVARRVFHFRQFGACFHKNMLKLVVKMRGGERQSKRKFRSALLPVLKYTHRWELWLNRNFYWAKEIFILFFLWGKKKWKFPGRIFYAGTSLYVWGYSIIACDGNVLNLTCFLTHLCLFRFFRSFWIKIET